MSKTALSDLPLKVGLAESLSRLEQAGAPFLALLSSLDVELEIYAPKGEDLQQPHSRDELYVIARGGADFRRADALVRVEAGDVLFVPAWVPHRFERFSDDFCTWVLFFGPGWPKP